MTFAKLCDKVAHALSTPTAFYISLLVYPAYVVIGPRLIDIVTMLSFSLIFILLNTSSRSDLAGHLKLDKLVDAIPGAPNEVQRAEELDEEAIRRLR